MAARPTPPPRPVIGIAADFLAPKTGLPFARVNAGYFDAVLAAGGLPVLLPAVKKENYPELDTYLDMVSGVILVGGLDLDPRKQGQPLTNVIQPMAARREESDRQLLAKVVERKMPVLGIGVGMQLINLHFGGTLFGHLPTDNPRAMPHFDQAGGTHRHMVNVEPNSTLDEIYGAVELLVNSQHHQAVNQVGKRLRVGAKAPDGVVEAIETTDDTWFCVGVQWHPEADTASALECQLFDCFVQSAGKYDPALVEV
jgi:putative glutamine amidotransferase